MGMIKFLTTASCGYALIVAIMFFMQRSLLYFPHTDLGPPASYGLSDAMEQLSLTTSDDVRVTAWYQPAQAGRPTLVHFHGNGGHLGFRASFFSEAVRRGYGVMALSYRGYGTSAGTPTEHGFYADAAAALDYLTAQGVIDDDIILYGESLGSGVAMHMGNGRAFQAIILQAPFTSVAARAAEIYWWLPVKWMIKDHYNSIGKVDNLHSPLLVLVAKNDHVIPPSHSEQLFEAASMRKEIRYFDDIGHNDFDPTASLDAMDAFLRSVIGMADQ